MLVQLALGVFLAALSSCLPSQTYSVEEILDNVEKADVSSVSATITYIRIDPILERREIRTGKVLFRTSEGKKREAAILFDTLIIGRRREEKQKHYIFSGRWMAEIDYENKQFIKRELVAPESEDIDPFELGRGPIPLPIGQTKESIRSKFEVTKIAKPDEGPLSKLSDAVVGVHLVPKTENDWESIDLFYDPTTWLPIGVQTVETDGTTRISRLTDLTLNEFGEEDKQLLNIDTPDPKEWSIDVRPWDE